MSDPIDPPPAPRRVLRWVVGALCVGAFLAAGAWWVSGRRFLTDDRTIHARAADAAVREILWTKPIPPAGEFNSQDEEYEPSLSPDGNELYFVRGKAGGGAEIFVSRREHGRWAAPAALVGVNSAADDLGPRLTPDGRFLLFYSDRPGGAGGYDLWAAGRQADGSWAEPFNLGASVNSEFNDYSPAPTPDGTRLYFASNRRAAAAEQKEAWRATIRQSAVGDYDLFVAEREVAVLPLPLGGEGRGEGEDAGAQTATATEVPHSTTQPATRPANEDGPPSQPSPPHPRPLPQGGEGGEALAYRAAAEVPGVNTAFHDGAPCVSPAGDFLYFASNRPGGVGKFDLYRCRLRDDGGLASPENLGREINTPENDTDPALAVGGFHLYFSSDRDSPVARGGYDLLASESREVYGVREKRATPALGWSWWVLLGAVALLLPLLSFFRGWNDHRLNLIQKCLLVSVLFHVLLTIGMSLFVVSKQIVEYVRSGDGGGGMEGAVAVVSGGGGGAGVDIGAEIRRQVSDAPVAMPEPQGLGQAQLAAEDLTPQQAAELSVSVPGVARPPAETMTVAVRPPIRETGASLAAAQPVDVASRIAEAMPPAAPELRFSNAAMRVTQLEPEARTGDAAGATGVARADSTPVPAASPQPVALGVGATDVAAAGAGAGPAVAPAPQLVRPNLLSIDPPGGVGAAGRGVGAGAEAVGAGPVIEGPSVPSVKVAAAGPAGGVREGAGATGVPSLGRQEAATSGSAAGIGPAAELLGGGNVPAADRAGGAGVGAGALGSSVASATPGPRVDALASVGAGNAPTPGASVTPLNAGAPSSVGTAGTGGGRKAVAAPAPEIAAADEGPAMGRAGTAGGTASGSSSPAAALAIAVNPAPASPGAAGPGTGVRGPATRPVGDAIAGVVESAGPGGAAAPAPATGVSPLATPALPGGAGAPVRVAAGGNGAAGPSVPTTADEPNFGGARLASGKEGLPVGPGSLPSSFGEPSRAPAVGPAAGTGGGLGGSGVGPRPRGGDLVAVPLNLEVAIAAPRVAAPEPLAQRSVAARKPLLERMGGTKQSEDAVERALAYLARQQEPDGRWTYVLPNSQRGRRGRYPHDMALTGLATLCFLAADHTPNRTGPYREGVEAGINFLIAGQRPDGDLRGPFAGGGADAGNLYDQGIATLALAEAALMTGDARITAAAMKGAEYIVKAQHRGTGGWRYVPGESGDTSIFGWQVMALHSAQQLGFEWPEASRELAKKYVRITSTGRHKSLGGYQPGNSPTPAMSAELLLARILLGEKLTPEQEEEVCKFLPRQSSNDFYGTYYASLSLVQLQNETWKKWNEKTRENLIRQQRRGGGEDDGCWDTHITWGERGGRVFSTALACLTLEVYYRYLPMNQGGEGAASQPAEGPVRPDIGYLPR